MSALFALALFVSSFLMFALEPMIAKMFLPHFGGAPAVWNTCLVFFQVALLAGYAFAHGTAQLLGNRWQALLYAAIVVIAGAMLPISVAEPADAAEQASMPWLFGALAVTIGAPFFVLAATASSLQKWFASIDHPAARDPYFLYAASNAGSLVGLLAYPTLFEASLTLGEQRSMWGFGYLVFAGIALACVVAAVARSGQTRATAPDTAAAGVGAEGRITHVRRLTWITLSAAPSSLLMGVTTVLSTDITPVPLLWVVPLSIYLVTFILAFGARSADRLFAATSSWAPALVCVFAISEANGARLPLWAALLLHLAMFFSLALACHSRLASERPTATHLTEFYLWISLGGMLGGLFNALVAPIAFDSLLEYPLAVMGACAIGILSAASGRRRPVRADVWVPLAIGGVTAGLLVAFTWAELPKRWLIPALIFPVSAAFGQRRAPLRFALAIGAILLGSRYVHTRFDGTLLTERTFFGIYRVVTEQTPPSRRLMHGTTVHGAQMVDAASAAEPMTYYTRLGPLGQAFEFLPQLSRPGDLAVVGLGVGSLAAYARPGQQWTFYEIDPAVERIARNDGLFSFLSRCGAQCQVVIGDARLSLRRPGDAQYSLIVLDAFSSDAIPMHLMTREAVALYVSKLAPDGVLAFHISNRHLALGPIVARLAEQERLFALGRYHRVGGDAQFSGTLPSDWVLITRAAAHLAPLQGIDGWQSPQADATTPLWTDDFSNILSVLR